MTEVDVNTYELRLGQWTNIQLGGSLRGIELVTGDWGESTEYYLSKE